MKKTLITTAAILLSLNSFSAEKVSIKVKGMVCSFCSTGVEKTFSKQKEVNSVKVDMDKKLVSIVFNNGSKMNDEVITKLITDSGFNVASINREEISEAKK